MNIIGIDPGTIRSGITHITGTVKKPKFETEMIGYDCEPNVLPKFEERLKYIFEKVTSKIDTVKPELVIIEYPYGISGNARKLIELFGLIRFHCILKNYKFIAMESTRLKVYATGRGRCEKVDIIIQAYMEFGMMLQEDAAESLFVALFGVGYLYPESIEKQFRIDSMKRMKTPKTKAKKKAKKKLPPKKKKISVLLKKSIFLKHFPNSTDEQFDTAVKMIKSRKGYDQCL